MQAGSLVGGDVRALTSFVRVAGVDRPHTSWSTAREIVGDLPEQVAAGGGIRQATGTIVWAAEENITDGSLNPWNSSTGWLPESGQFVEVWAGDGTSWWRQFTGVIDVTTGDIGEGAQSTVVDYIDWLNRSVEHSTVFRMHPPVVEGGAYMAVGMGPMYAIDRATRTCGFYATPRRESGCLVSAPLQGSLWHELGKLVASPRFNSNYKAPWGWTAGDFTATYTPQSGATRSAAIQLTLRVGFDHDHSATLAAVYGSLEVQLVITAGRVASACLDGVQVCSLTLGADSIVTLLVKSGAWTLRTPTATATGSKAVPGGSDLTQVTLLAHEGSRLAGMQVSSPPTGQEFGSLGHVDSFIQDSQGLSGTMSVLPSFTKSPAIDVLTSISKATLSPFWFDERGYLRMVSSDVLIAQAPAQTVTTLDDITKLSWSDDRLSVRSKVTVSYRDVATSRSSWSSIDLFQGSSETLESGDERAFFVTEPADQDWCETGENSDGSLVAFNRGRGSWMSGYLEDDDGVYSSGVGYAVQTQSRITTDTMLYTTTIGTLPIGKHYVVGIPENPGYAPRFRNIGSPIFRGRGKATWTDTTVTSTVTGPSGFPELVHDASHWLTQEGSNILQSRMADFIAAQVTTQHPTITGMEVIFDPRRQLGDVIVISSPDYMGVELTVLIVGIRLSAGDSFTQSLDVRVISSKTTFTTYAEHEKAYPDSLTYEQWTALYPDTTTYTGFNTDPLRGAS